MLVVVRVSQATLVSGSPDAKGPRAGYDPVMKKPIKRKKTIGLWSGSLKKKKKKK